MAPVVALRIRCDSRLKGKASYGHVSFDKYSDPSTVNCECVPDWESPLHTGSKTCPRLTGSLEYAMSKTPMTDEGVKVAANGRADAVRRRTNMNTTSIPADSTVETMRAESAVKEEARRAAAAAAGQTRVAPPKTEWKNPDKMVQRLRALAISSGKKYEARVKRGLGKRTIVWRR